MQLYLVQHGEAKSEAEDPQRSLTDSECIEVRVWHMKAGVGLIRTLHKLNRSPPILLLTATQNEHDHPQSRISAELSGTPTAVPAQSRTANTPIIMTTFFISTSIRIDSATRMSTCHRAKRD